MTPLLSVKDLRISFPVGGRFVPVVDGVSLDIEPGEITALVGESGSGKSLTAISLLDLVPKPGRIESGQILFEGTSVLAMTEREKCHLRGGKIGFVFQEPALALDPVRRAGEEVRDVIRRHLGLSRKEARKKAIEWLLRVRLPDPETRYLDYPHMLSGGMRQRLMLALALSGNPKLLVADEPTTALDVTIQRQILDLLASLRDEFQLAVLIVTHDLGVVLELASRALVMYSGRLVETGPVASLVKAPLHPYTKALLDARVTGGASRGRLAVIPGNVPRPGERPQGCAFEPRCALASPLCKTRQPVLSPAGKTNHHVSCFAVSETGPGGLD